VKAASYFSGGGAIPPPENVVSVIGILF